MHARWLRLSLLCCALWLSLGTAHAQQTLYAATTDGDAGGNLYTVDPATAAATLVGPLLVGGTLPIGVTGLDFNPLTGVLYGVTDDGSPHFPDYLVTIDRASGAATVIGPLGQILTDISFDSTGMLYGWIGQASGNHLVSINLSTGAATIIGPSPPPPYVNDGGLAFSPGGILYVVNNNLSVFLRKAILRTVDKTTGTTTDGPMLVPDDDRDINAMKFNSAGKLFASAVNSDGFSTLYTIDTTTGAVTAIGPLPSLIGFPEHTNALAFTPAAARTFLIRYSSNLNIGDSFIDITNTGASATTVLTNQNPAQNNIDGSVCVNIYTFAADEQEVACCSCLVTPNALWSASVKTALLNSVLTPSFPNEVVVKLISTVPAVGAGGTQTCNPAAVSQGNVKNGLLAWGTSLHGLPTATGPTFRLAETPFLPANLSTAELVRDVEECQFIQVLGSGQFGICKGCSNAGLGAAQQ